MEISIKLKFLEALSDNKSLEILRVLTKGDMTHQISSNVRIDKPTLEDPPLISHRETSILRMPRCETPRQAVTQRCSRSKEIRRDVESTKGFITNRNKNFSKQRKRSNKHKDSVSFMEQGVSKPKRKEEKVFTGCFNGLDGKKIMKEHSLFINEYERAEILNEKSVYYVGRRSVKMMPNGDDPQGNLIWDKHDHVGFRYEVIEKLGSGSFGEVVKGFDHKTKDLVAIKIIKSNKEYFQLALNEIRVLTLIKQKDPNGEKNCIRIKDFLVFRKHMCIVFELLSISLYDLMKANHFEQMKMEFIRRFAIQILTALAFMKDLSVIHSDIKPENILLKSRSRTGIKVIDFGTSILQEDEHYSYVQSRYYRAPEVILGFPYSFPIDMWSTACLLGELYLGVPLFGGNNEQEQLQLIMTTVGSPPIDYLRKCRRMELFFHPDYSPRYSSKENVELPASRSLKAAIKGQPEFVDFLERILIWETESRMTPIEALLHPWIIDHLPKDIREQHILSLKPQIPKNRSVHQEEKEPKTSRKTSSKPKHQKRNSEVYQYEKKSHRQTVIELQCHQRKRSDL